MRNIIAFDVSMGKSYVVHYEGNTCKSEFEMNHSKTNFEALKSLIDSIIQEISEQPFIVFESTGSYSKPLEYFMVKNNYDYCLLNPLEAKKQCDGLRRNKTDRTDAHKLALSSLNFERKNKTVSDERYEQLKELSRFHEELVDELVTTKNKLHSVLQKTFPEIENSFSSKDSELFLNTIECFPHPELVLNHSKTVIRNILLKNTRKNLSKRQALKYAEKLINLAEESTPGVSENDSIIWKVNYLVNGIRRIKDTKEVLLKEMIGLSKDLPEYKILLSIPGIGELTAVRFIAEAGDIRRFSNNRKLNAFAGIDIAHHQSGKTTYEDYINKRGNKTLRKLLYLIISNMIKGQNRFQNHIINYYYRLKSQPMNKCHKVAIVACMNKLLKVIHHLINTNQMYDFRFTSH